MMLDAGAYADEGDTRRLGRFNSSWRVLKNEAVFDFLSEPPSCQQEAIRCRLAVFNVLAGYENLWMG